MKFIIEVSDKVAELINQHANMNKISEVDYIVKILNNYVIDLHSIEQEALARGYAECGEINLDWANL